MGDIKIMGRKVKLVFNVTYIEDLDEASEEYVLKLLTQNKEGLIEDLEKEIQGCDDKVQVKVRYFKWEFLD